MRALRSKRCIPAALVALTLAACTGNITGEGGEPGAGGPGSGAGGGGGASPPPPDVEPPVIEIISPLRGAMVEGSTVEITGRVYDAASAVTDLHVNGDLVKPEPDGSFELTLSVPAGITMIETYARDQAGNEQRDVRSVLAGTMVDQATPVKNGITAHLGTTALRGFTSRVSTAANQTNLTSLARALNPLVNTGSSCNSAKIYVDSVARSGVSVTSAPVTDGLDTSVSVRDLVVRGRVTFRALCISGSTSWTIRATSYNVRGLAKPYVGSGDIRVGIANVTSGFRNFQLSVGRVPGFITDLIRTRVRDRLASMLRTKVTQIVPAQATAFLDEFRADSWSTSLLGQTANFTMVPTSMSWNSQGGSIGLEVKSSLRGVTGNTYLSTPRARPSTTTMTSTGLRVSLADDVVNQLLAGLWATSGLEAILEPVIASALAGFGTEVAGAAVTLMLPPVATFDTEGGTARLAIGDLVLEALDESGRTLVKVAVSADLELAAGSSADSRMKVVTEGARVRVQALNGEDEFLSELDPATLDSLATAAVQLVAREADRVLAAVPVPGLTGVSITSPTVTPVDGYLILGGPLTFQ
jgi:hypothetical protein